MSNLDSKPLQGKIALVTGASRGIGRAIAKGLAADGALVAVHFGGSSAAAAQTVGDIKANGGDAFAVQADLAQKSGPETLFKSFDAELEARTGSSKFDILVNNAGVAPFADIEHLEETEFDRLTNVNIRAVYFVSKFAAERLRDGGRIINLSSGVTRIGLPSALAYAATKGWVDSFTLSLAGHLGARNITVNAIAPGVIQTDMAEAILASGAETILSRQALKRLGQPEDIASLARLLAGPGGGWTTGQIIDATGGTGISL
jgi:NAD(P)-dependent dehydrogenase (short-subunit alcohol dehydrogenase family)